MSGHTSLTEALARRALEPQLDAMPDDVLQIAAQALLDWYSLVLASRGDASTVALREWVEEGGGAPQAALIGSNTRCRIGDAALVNGTASHLLDFDDAHLPSRVHPSVPLWPAILALAEWRDLSGAALLAAFVAGVEVQSRLARAMGASHYSVGWHNTSTIGSIGATAAAARLLNLSVEQCMHAFGLAATQAGGLRASFGTPAKPLHAGRAASNGLFSAQMAERGYEGARDIFDRADGYPAVTAREFQPDRAFAQPEHWEVRDIVFKYHASCYGTQAPIDAVLAAAEAFDRPVADAVESVAVTVETQYLSVCNVASPTTSAQAKFSIRHTVALALAGYDTLSEASFSPEACADPLLSALREKVSVTGCDAMSRANAEVVLKLRNGRAHTTRADASVPERDLVRQEKRLREKSARLLAGHVDASRIGALQDQLLWAGSARSIATWHPGVQRLLGI